MQTNTKFIPLKRTNELPRGKIVSVKIQGVDLMIAQLNGEFVVAHARYLMKARIFRIEKE